MIRMVIVKTENLSPISNFHVKNIETCFFIVSATNATAYCKQVQKTSCLNGLKCEGNLLFSNSRGTNHPLD